MTNYFQQSETEGRKLFKEILDQSSTSDYKFSTATYDRIDCRVGDIAVEIKKRNVKYLKYDDLIMEKSKYDAMMQIITSDQHLNHGLYVNFLGSDTVRLFSLERIQQQINEGKIQAEWQPCKRTTAIYTGEEDKLVYHLPISLATTLVKKDGIWKQQ